MWNSSEKISITRQMRDELDLLTTIANSLDKHRWKIPIRYVILTAFDYTATGDAYLTDCGAFCLELKFWYHTWCPPKVVCLTVKFIKKRSPNLISINWLECATMLFSCNAVLDSMWLRNSNIRHTWNHSYEWTTPPQAYVHAKLLHLQISAKD